MSELRDAIAATYFADENAASVLLDLADKQDALENRVTQLERFLQYGPEKILKPTPPVPDGADDNGKL